MKLVYIGEHRFQFVPMWSNLGGCCKTTLCTGSNRYHTASLTTSSDELLSDKWLRRQKRLPRNGLEPVGDAEWYADCGIVCKLKSVAISRYLDSAWIVGTAAAWHQNWISLATFGVVHDFNINPLRQRNGALFLWARVRPCVCPRNDWNN